MAKYGWPPPPGQYNHGDPIELDRVEVHDKKGNVILTIDLSNCDDLEPGDVFFMDIDFYYDPNSVTP